jgi:thioredoxin-related protein
MLFILSNKSFSLVVSDKIFESFSQSEAIIDNRGYVFCEISFDSRRSEKYLLLILTKGHIIYCQDFASFVHPTVRRRQYFIF